MARAQNVIFVVAAGVMVLFPPWTTETRWRDETGHGLGKWKPDTVRFDGYHFWGYEADGAPDSSPDIVKIEGPMPKSIEPYVPARQPKVAIRSETTTSVNYMVLMTQLVLLFGLRRLKSVLADRRSRSRSSNFRV